MNVCTRYPKGCAKIQCVGRSASPPPSVQTTRYVFESFAIRSPCPSLSACPNTYTHLQTECWIYLPVHALWFYLDSWMLLFYEIWKLICYWEYMYILFTGTTPTSGFTIQTSVVWSRPDYTRTYIHTGCLHTHQYCVARLPRTVAAKGTACRIISITRATDTHAYYMPNFP